MAIDTKLMTAEEFGRLEPDEGLVELVRGEIAHMPPPGHRHGRLIARVLSQLFAKIESTALGVVVSGSGIVLERNPDSVLAPDIAVFLGPTVPPIEDDQRYVERAPDLVVEVVSPSDLAASVNSKVNIYLESGVRMVIVVWPDERMVSVSTPDRLTKTLSAHESIDLGELISGESLAVSKLFF